MPRPALVAAAAGALLVGGAVTGGTSASWTGSAALAEHSVAAGAITLTPTPAATSLTVERGQTATTLVQVADTSTGRNLVRQVRASVAGTNGVATALHTAVGGACTTTPQGTVTTGQSFGTCVSVTVPSASTATSSDVTLTLVGEQVQRGVVTGWTRTVTVPISVTIRQSPQVPVRPSLTCGLRSGNNVPVGWTTVEGETYTVEVSTTSATSGFASAPGANPYVAVMGTNNTHKYVRVKSTVGSASSAYSNVVRVSQANGASSITCGEVSP
jgi:hypothetical protein